MNGLGSLAWDRVGSDDRLGQIGKNTTGQMGLERTQSDGRDRGKKGRRCKK